MKKNIYRNIALVTMAFAIAVATMMAVSWWQMRRATPLQTEVMETLKQLGDANPDNAVLSGQIRQLDLLSRKAYFTGESQLKTGGWILCAMAAVIAFCLRMYYSAARQLPSKDLDTTDEWLTKSHARRYLRIGAACLVAVGLIAVALGPISKRSRVGHPRADGDEWVATDTMPSDTPLPAQALLPEVLRAPEDPNTLNNPLVPNSPDNPGSSTVPEEPSDTLPIPKLTWNAFRGNGGSGRSSVRGLPTTWNLKSGKNVLWQKPIPRHGYSSPVVNGRNIFVTGADAEGRELYCFDLWTGELRWTLRATGISGSPGEMPDVSADTGLAASTVATNGKQVCAIFATGDVICADMDGKRLWAKNLGVPDNHYGYASSLLMYGSELIIQYDNNVGARLMALSVTSGRELWSRSRTDKIAWSSPILTKAAGKQAVIVVGNPAVTAYQASNGQELWRVECMSGEVGASACASDGVVYAASEYATCVAINASDGEVLWQADDCLPECSSPVATKNKLYVATSYGAVCAYDAASGKVIVQHELTTPFYSSPVIADGRVWLFSNSGKCYIFSTRDDFRLITSFDTGENTFATPAFTDSMMIVRTDKSLYVVRKE